MPQPVPPTPNLTAHLSESQAVNAATDFLLDHLGSQFLAGQPYLMVSAVRSVWVVPVHLTYIHTGPIGTVGVVAIDEETGQAVAWTPIGDMKAAAQALRDGAEPGLSRGFQQFMTRHENMGS